EGDRHGRPGQEARVARGRPTARSPPAVRPGRADSGAVERGAAFPDRRARAPTRSPSAGARSAASAARRYRAGPTSLRAPTPEVSGAGEGTLAARPPSRERAPTTSRAANEAAGREPRRRPREAGPR